MAQEELNAADQEKNIGIAVLSFISLVTLVFYFFVRNALSVIRVCYLTSFTVVYCIGLVITYDVPSMHQFCRFLLRK